MASKSCGGFRLRSASSDPKQRRVRAGCFSLQAALGLTALAILMSSVAAAQASAQPSAASRGAATARSTQAPIAPVGTEPNGPLRDGLLVYVRRIEVVGSTVLSEHDLAAVTAPFENRLLSSDELQELRLRLSRLYVERGYVNSGARIPDQEVVDGVVRIEITEGRLTRLEIRGTERLRDSYLRERIVPDPNAPLNVEVLQERLQVLQQDVLIERLVGTLRPGSVPGESVLDLEVAEAQPYRLGIIFANDRPPAVGAEQLRIHFAHHSVSGRGDSLVVEPALTEGLRDLSVAYALPLPGGRTQLELFYEDTNADVVEEPFDEVDITGSLTSFGAGLRYWIVRRPGSELSMGLRFDRRRGRTTLLDRPAPLSPGADDDGRTELNAIRFSQDWLARGLDRVVAARSLLTFGLSGSSSARPGGDADGSFVSWQGQFQWVQRLAENDAQLIARTAAQVATRALLPMEQFQIGGAQSVRGYRESQLLRDNGITASLEYRIPLGQVVGRETAPSAWHNMQLAFFGDIGHGVNREFRAATPHTLASLGLGLVWDPAPGVHGELYWGYALRERPTGDDLQDEGVHFSIQLFY